MFNWGKQKNTGAGGDSERRASVVSNASTTATTTTTTTNTGGFCCFKPSKPKLTKTQADISIGSTDVATRLRNLTVLQVETGKRFRIGDFWEEHRVIEGTDQSVNGGLDLTTSSPYTPGSGGRPAATKGGVTDSSNSSNSHVDFFGSPSFDPTVTDQDGATTTTILEAPPSSSSQDNNNTKTAATTTNSQPLGEKQQDGVPPPPEKPKQLRLETVKPDSPVVIVLLRRFGCPLCRMLAANISALKPAFDSVGVRLIGLGLELEGYHSYVKGGFWKGELYVDESAAAHHAVRCEVVSWRNLWGLTGTDVSRLVGISKKRGFTKDSNFSGNQNQFGATFIVSPETGALMYGHFQSPKSFEPDLEDMMRVCAVPVPEDYDRYAVSYVPGKGPQYSGGAASPLTDLSNESWGSFPDSEMVNNPSNSTKQQGRNILDDAVAAASTSGKRSNSSEASVSGHSVRSDRSVEKIQVRRPHLSEDQVARERRNAASNSKSSLVSSMAASSSLLSAPFVSSTNDPHSASHSKGSFDVSQPSGSIPSAVGEEEGDGDDDDNTSIYSNMADNSDNHDSSSLDLNSVVLNRGEGGSQAGGYGSSSKGSSSGGRGVGVGPAAARRGEEGISTSVWHDTTRVRTYKV